MQEWGIVPTFLDPRDPRPAWEQIDEHYQAGWHPLPGFEITETDSGVMLAYAGDPPLHSISALRFRDETLYMCPHEWCVAKGRSGEWEACRLD